MGGRRLQDQGSDAMDRLSSSQGFHLFDSPCDEVVKLEDFYHGGTMRLNIETAASDDYRFVQVSQDTPGGDGAWHDVWDGNSQEIRQPRVFDLVHEVTTLVMNGGVGSELVLTISS